MDDKRLEQLTIGYDLDGGGYAFTEPTAEALKGLACVMWMDPDPDYIPWIFEACQGFGRFGYNEVDGPVYLFAPNTGHSQATQWPETYQDGEAGQFVLIAHGHLSPSDHECNCRGVLVEGENTNTGVPLSKAIVWVMQGKATTDVTRLESAENLCWEYTGEDGCKPHPECPRCGGSGYVESEGGEWALYGCVPSTLLPDYDEEHIGDDQGSMYFRPFEYCGHWFVSMWAENNTPYAYCDLPTGGPFKSEAEAREYGRIQAKQWCHDNGVPRE